MRSARCGSLVVVALVATAAFAAAPAPAHACSCVTDSVQQSVAAADAVYVAQPRLPDPLPGRSVRVLEVLDGPIRHNVRVDVASGSEASCGTSVGLQPFVLTYLDDHPQQLSLCSEHLRGVDAVAQARAVLGPGEPVGWRPPWTYGVQWVVLLGLGVTALALVRRRRRG